MDVLEKVRVTLVGVQDALASVLFCVRQDEYRLAVLQFDLDCAAADVQACDPMKVFERVRLAAPAFLLRPRSADVSEERYAAAVETVRKEYNRAMTMNLAAGREQTVVLRDTDDVLAAL